LRPRYGVMYSPSGISTESQSLDGS
jgi:hypothetical protein